MKTLQYKEIIHGLPPVLTSEHVISLDLELSNLREEQKHRPAGQMLSLAGCFDGETIYIIFEESEVQEYLNRISAATWVFHNSVFDLGHLRRWAEITERKAMRDTLLIERIMWSNYYSEFGLQDLVRRYLKCYMDKTVRKEFYTWTGAMTQEQIVYSALDVVGTWLVDREQQKIIDANDKVIWNNLYNPHVWTVLELGGFRLDVDAWIKLADDNQAIVDEITERLGKKYGKEKIKLVGRGKNRHEEVYFDPFNPGSHVQVKKVLLTQYQLDLESTDEDHLMPYVDKIDFVKDMLDYRKAEKQVSTYGLKFLKNVEEDGRIYSSMNIGLAITGRDCVYGDTILETSMGDFAISDLPLAAIGHCSILTHTGEQQKILRKIYKGKEEMFEVTLDNGSKIKCTKGHKFLTAEGWKHLYELNESDRLLDPPLPN